MATVVNELVTKFSFHGSTDPLNKYNTTLVTSIKLLTGMTAAILASGAALGHWANDQLKGVDALSELSNTTGVSVKNLQRLEYMAGQTQSTAEAMRSTIKSLTSVIGAAAQNGNEDFQRLGISVRDANGHVKTADQVLFQVSRRFQQLHLSMAEQEHYASALGIDTSLIQMMKLTGHQVDQLRMKANRLGVLNKQQTQQAYLYTKSMRSMWFGLSNLKELIAVGVAPNMARLANQFTTLLIKNRAWIVGGVQFAVKWGTLFMASINRMAPILAGAAVAMIALKVATMGFRDALAMVGKTGVMLVISAIYLAVDDLVTAFKGGHSVIASFFKSTFNINIVKALTAGFHILGGAVGVLVDSLKELWSLWSKLVSAVVSGGAKIAAFFGYGGANSIQVPSQGKGAAQTIPAFTIPPSGAQTSNSKVIQQNNTFKVYGQNPQDTARAIDSHLQRQMRHADSVLGAGGQ